MLRMIAFMIAIVLFALSPPAASADVYKIKNAMINIDQGAIDQLDPAFLVTGNHGGNGHSVGLSPPAIYVSNYMFDPVGIGKSSTFAAASTSVKSKLTHIGAAWPDMRNNSYKSINIAAYVAPKAGPLHSIVE